MIDDNDEYCVECGGINTLVEIELTPEQVEESEPAKELRRVAIETFGVTGPIIITSRMCTLCKVASFAGPDVTFTGTVGDITVEDDDAHD